MASSTRRVRSMLGAVCACWVTCPAPIFADPPVSLERPPVIRTAGHDPANVLYICTHIYGGTLSYERVAEVLPSSGRRVTLLDMRDAAARLDLALEVVRWTPAQALHTERPVITILDAPPPQEPEYVLLVGPTRDKRVLYVAGSNATIHAMSEDDFRRRWSGLVLAPAPAARVWPRAAAAGGIAGCGYAAFVWWRRRREPHPTASQS